MAQQAFQKNIYPKRSLGQNFLVDAIVIQKIMMVYDQFSPAKASNLRVVEIGPGMGALTFQLAKRSGTLVAVEKDAVLADRLRNTPLLNGMPIHTADALTFDFNPILQGSDSVRFVGNLPYNVANPIIFKLLFLPLPVGSDLIIMVQKEVAQRMAASLNTPEYGRLSILIQSLAQVDCMFDVGPEAFSPRPKVDSTVVRLTPLANPLADAHFSVLSKLTALCFQQRRKQLGKLLRKMGFTDEVLEHFEIRAEQRPQELSIDTFIALSGKWMSLTDRIESEVNLFGKS